MSQKPPPDDPNPEDTPEDLVRRWYKKNAIHWKMNMKELDSVMRGCKDCLLDPDSEVDLESVIIRFADLLQSVGQTAVKLRSFLEEQKAAEKVHGSDGKQNETEDDNAR